MEHLRPPWALEASCISGRHHKWSHILHRDGHRDGHTEDPDLTDGAPTPRGGRALSAVTVAQWSSSQPSEKSRSRLKQKAEINHHISINHQQPWCIGMYRLQNLEFPDDP